MAWTLNSHAHPLTGFLAALRHRIQSFRAHGRHRQEVKSLSGLPNHLLRDIGREELIKPRAIPMPVATNLIC